MYSVFMVMLSTVNLFHQEELALYERRVGFSSDTEHADEEGSARGEGKLRRRDTPHHLKNKRIAGSTGSVKKIAKCL